MTSPAPLSLLATTSQQPVTVVTKNQPAAAIIASQLLAAAEATTAASHLHPATMAHQPEGLTPQDRNHPAGATMVATMDEKRHSAFMCGLQTSGSSSSCYLKPPKFCSLERL